MKKRYAFVSNSSSSSFVATAEPTTEQLTVEIRGITWGYFRENFYSLEKEIAGKEIAICVDNKNDFETLMKFLDKNGFRWTSGDNCEDIYSYKELKVRISSSREMVFIFIEEDKEITKATTLSPINKNVKFIYFLEGGEITASQLTLEDIIEGMLS